MDAGARRTTKLIRLTFVAILQRDSRASEIQRIGELSVYVDGHGCIPLLRSVRCHARTVGWKDRIGVQSDGSVAVDFNHLVECLVDEDDGDEGSKALL